MLPYLTTILCETGFYSSFSIKTEVYELNAEGDMRIQLSSINPDILKKFLKTEQFHSSD